MPKRDEGPLADRATLANMAPEYGATCGFFPVDGITLDYLRLSGRPEQAVQLVEAYCKAQGLWRSEDAPEPRFSDTLELDLADVVPSLAGPKRPQDRLARLQADKIEMELAERRGVLIPADLLEPRLQAAFTAARERWLEAAPRLARELPADAEAREALLQAEFEAFLHRLADWANAGVDEGDDE